MDNHHIHLHVIIKGRVQGVWYRAWTTEKALSLGLLGWVRNRSDGSVEAVFSGPQQSVQQMLKLASKGPVLARVDEIVSNITEAPNVSGFEKWPTT